MANLAVHLLEPADLEVLAGSGRWLTVSIMLTVLRVADILMIPALEHCRTADADGRFIHVPNVGIDLWSARSCLN